MTENKPRFLTAEEMMAQCVASEAQRKFPAEKINHPVHYGGEGNLFEAIKVIEAWNLGFNLGNVVKYISRAGRKGQRLEDLQKARWYLDREITNLRAGL